MSRPDTTALHVADDRFERYYAEKLWEWIPEMYRAADGRENDGGGTLRALVESVARQAAVIRRDIDRLWDDQHIALADDWAVPYIGDLLGTRPVSELNRRGQRVAVARTVFYRRRRGTLTVLEALIRDIGDFDGAVVEAFRRLARLPHRLDRPPGERRGPITGTPPGGTVDLRCIRIGDIVDGPFDDLAHTVDVRRLRGPLGRYNIPKVNFHLFTLPAHQVRLATPFDLGGGRYTFDPTGRDTALFQPRQRADETEAWRRLREWKLPGPLTAGRFNAARFALSREQVPPALFAELAPLATYEFRTEPLFRQWLALRLSATQYGDHVASLLDLALTEDSPKRHLWPGAAQIALGAHAGAAPLDWHAVQAADLDNWGVAASVPAGRRLVLDPARGRFMVLGPLAGDERVFAQRYHYGLAYPVGAGPYDRAAELSPDDEVAGTLPTGPINADGFFTDLGPVTGVMLPTTGVHRVPTSKTYVPNLEGGQVWGGIRDLTLEAADGERPYLRFEPPAAHPAVTIVAAAGGAPPSLVIDGVWLGIQPPDLAANAGGAARLVLDGEFGTVVFRHCTLDPGGERARTDPQQRGLIPAVSLEIAGQVGELRIERCITGPIGEAVGGERPGAACEIVIVDSIVHGHGCDRPAIASRIASVTLQRSTVFGNVQVNRLSASEALIQGYVWVADNQHGCFRFSATDAGTPPQLPPQFEAHLIEPWILDHAFVSRRFGDPGYAKLSATAPRVLHVGGENRTEVGVYSRRLATVRREDLQAKVDEYLPFGLIAQFIEET